jgi:hypothetical protein
MLEELVHPFHLLAEGRALHHCIDQCYERPPEEVGMSRLCQNSAVLLKYWIEIENQWSRLFSFTNDGRPLATIEYVPEVGIVEIRGKHNHQINGTEPYYSKLMSALQYVRGLEIRQ